MSRALGFPSFAALLVCLVAASSIESRLRAISLDMPLLLAFKALFRF